MSRTSTISMWTSRLHRRKSQWVVDEALLRSLTPLNLLDVSELKGLLPRSSVRNIDAGQEIGVHRDGSTSTFYLLSGTVDLISHGEVVTVVAAGTDAAKHPLVKPKSKGVMAKAKVDCTVLEVDTDTDELLDRLNGPSDYEVSDIRSATDTDWLTCFLQAKVFMRLPPSNIRELLSQMEEIPVKAGQEIMRQGESDDYYYIVKEGRCRVTTKAPSGKGEVDVAELREGDGFGEDALITDGRRGATVTMVNDGSLMRLSKEAFTSLLVKPVLKYVTWEQAQGLMGDGAVLLDVRRPEEYGADGIDGAVNIPLNLLRSRAQELDISRPHITISNVLNRSSVAAFFLCQQGIDACILKEGTQVPAARLQPAPERKKHDAPAPPVAQVTPIRSKAAPKKDAVDRELKKSLDAVKRELEHERGHKKDIENQLAKQYSELQQLRHAREADARLGSELAAVKAELERLTRHKHDLEQRLEEKDRALQDLNQLQAREKDLNDRVAGLEESLVQEKSAKLSIEQEMAAQHQELQRIQQAREEEGELKDELSSLQGELVQARARSQALEEQHAATMEELQRTQQAHDADGTVQMELEAASQELAHEKEQRQVLEEKLARTVEELQRLQHVLEIDDELRSELSSVKRALERESEAKQEIQGRLAAQEVELQQLHQAQHADAGLKAELVAVRRRLERELELNKVIEKQLERQHEEMQRLQEEGKEDSALVTELAAVKEDLVREKTHKEEALRQIETQNESLQRLDQQLNKFRHRLKKVVRLARSAEKQRRDAEKQAEAAELNLKAIRQDIDERSLRFAEMELERRKLERTVATLNTQQSTASYGVFRSPDNEESTPRSGAIRVSRFTEVPAEEGHTLLRLPPPQGEGDIPSRGSSLHRLQRFAARALIWIILIGVAIVFLYGMAFTGAFKVKAASREDGSSGHSGVLSSFSSLHLKLPFTSEHADKPGGRTTPGNK